MLSFFILLFIIIVIYLITTNEVEGFDPMSGTPPSHQVNIPTSSVPTAISALPALKNTSTDIGSAITRDLSDVPQARTMPGELPVAPYEQVAAMSPLPYQDTTLIKANRQQLVSLLELIKGFLAFEAQEIAEKSDPSIQLPLTTARSDFHTLQSEVNVLNRNPGLQPTITLTTYNEIASNLAYLQEKVRLMGAAGSLQGPIYEFTQEGFLDKMVGKQPVEMREIEHTIAKNQNKVNTQVPDAIATPDDLAKLVPRIQSEIQRLSSSATTDPNVQARVAQLTNMKADVQQQLVKLKKGDMKATDITIKKKDIDKAFPPMNHSSVGSAPHTAAVKALASKLGTSAQSTDAINKYADQIANGLSVSFGVKYISPREAQMAQAQAQAQSMQSYPHKQMHASAKSKQDEIRRHQTSTIDQTGFPSMTDLDNATNQKFSPYDDGTPVSDVTAPTPMDAGRGPSHFDWRQRAKQIEDQVKKRGLNPHDFGILPEGTKTSTDFSWKGYTRMMCTRLMATTDPGLPETCGCPPMDWKGWRSVHA
jgi:hypothetical protein